MGQIASNRRRAPVQAHSIHHPKHKTCHTFTVRCACGPRGPLSMITKHCTSWLGALVHQICLRSPILHVSIEILRSLQRSRGIDGCPCACPWATPPPWPLHTGVDACPLWIMVSYAHHRVIWRLIPSRGPGSSTASSHRARTVVLGANARQR